MTIDRPTLERRLAEAQTAYHDLMTGQREVSLSYAQGDGMKSVTYTAMNLPALKAYIAELTSQLGIGRRRAIGVRFNG